jgi:hypothetical protein
MWKAIDMIQYFLLHIFGVLSLFDTMLNFVENLLENERDPRQDQ